jgi:hypothetical protein
MNDLITPDSPVIIPESIIIHPDGELSRGLYYYVITAVQDKESIPSHILQVYASNKENSISFEWKYIPWVLEYRIYRGTVLGKYDGYFSIEAAENTCYFCDSGRGLLNENVCQ